ncbi:MAG: hypothetical protein SFU91_15190 [Chloroherpetonaceae bacterium]|nr:hypothetical protein [Chloroherpetonaceae bacterium]
MRNNFYRHLVVSTVLLLLIVEISYAQRSKDDDYFGISARFAFPQQNMSNYNTGFGGLLMDELVLSKTVSLAAEIGLWQFSAKDNIPTQTTGSFENTLRTISLMGGVKYYFGDFYVMGVAGLLYSSFESKLLGESIFLNRAGLGLQPSVGLHYGILDVAAEYTFKISSDPLRSWIGLRVGVYLLDFHL